jgi:hypothetical protein
MSSLFISTHRDVFLASISKTFSTMARALESRRTFTSRFAVCSWLLVWILSLQFGLVAGQFGTISQVDGREVYQATPIQVSSHILEY